MTGESGAAPPAAAAGDDKPAYPVLAQEHWLWKRWRDEGDGEARERIVAHYLSYARALAARLYGRRVHDDVEFDEYAQFAAVGLMEAVNRFDASRGVLFKTYATRRIVGAVLSGLTSLTERQQQIGLRRRMAEDRLASLREEPLASVPSEELLRRLADIGVGLALGLMLEGTGMIAGDEAALPDNTYARVEMRQFRERVAQLVGQLTPREQDIIRRHYLQGIAFDDIARELDLSKGRVSQLHRQGLARLRGLILQSKGRDVVLL